MTTIEKTVHFLRYSSLILAFAFISGCASDKAASNTKPDSAAVATQDEKTPYKNRQYAANPSKVKFSEFKTVELKASTLKPEENNEGNQKSAKVIDDLLAARLKTIWPDLKVVPVGGDFSKSEQRTLQIIPRIEHIRLVSIGGRIWLGVMAGGSDLVTHVDYRDSSTGEIIANPDFWKGNNAWSGGWSFGATDNQIRDAVVSQIVGYTTANR